MLTRYFIFSIIIGIQFECIALDNIDTLRNYVDLKIYSGIKDTVYIKHERYFGLFVKSDCVTENYGTTLLSKSGCWTRLHANFSPRFWAIGGKSPDHIIGTIVEEIDAINSAAIAAYKSGGDTIEIDSFYPIDRSVFLLENNTYLGTSDSAGFYRVSPPKTVLTDTAYVGDKLIRVADNSGFRTRQKINIISGNAYDQIAGHASYTASIPPKDKTTIRLSGLSIQKTMYPGDSITLVYPLMVPRFSSVDNIHIKNLVFHGNRKHNNLTHDWRVNNTISLPTSKGTVIEECRFYEIPSENIFLCGATFKNCSGSAFNGSIIHFSCNSDGPVTQVLYNNFSSVNNVGDSIMEHSEAGLTFSAKVKNIKVAYNEINNTKEFGVGIYANDDSHNEITDNILDSPIGEIGYNFIYNFNETNVIYNNKNPHLSDISDKSCWQSIPKVSVPFQCEGNSTPDQPLQLGDTIKIEVDSIWVRNSNENFIKCIAPIYDSKFFNLLDISIQTPPMSDRHLWSFDSSGSICNGAVFDNGHINGKYGNGNWGYEPCGEKGNCSDVAFYFKVIALPNITSETCCPLKGVEIIYDGEIGSWRKAPTCQNTPVIFDPNTMGSPYLAGIKDGLQPYEATAEILDSLVRVTAIGGIEPYKYSQDGVNFQDNNQFLISDGFYNFQVQDKTGCLATACIPPTFNSESTNIIKLCAGEDLSISVESPNTKIYKWQKNGEILPGQTTPGIYLSNITFEDQGIYSVELSNSCGSTIVDFNILISDPSATISIKSPLCSGDANGEINITSVEKGIEPYFYSVDGIEYQSEPKFSVGAGDYNVAIIDSIGCENQFHVTVSEPSQIIPTIKISGALVEVFATGGIPPYEYSKDGLTFQSTNDFHNSTGQQTFYVKDQNNCIANISAFVITTELIDTSRFEVIAFPNPFQAEFSIKACMEIQRLIIYENSGNTIYKRHDINKPEVTINTTDFVSGTYIMEVILINRTKYNFLMLKK